MSATNRYRPVLSANEVQFLHKLLKKTYVAHLSCESGAQLDSLDEQYITALIAKLATLETKIANNAIAPAYSTKHTLSRTEQLLEDLGEPITPATPTANPGERRKAAYEKLTSQGELACTVYELADATEYKFQAGLMSEQEAKDYEARMWKQTMLDQGRGEL